MAWKSKEQQREYNRKYYQANKEKCRQRVKEWVEENRDRANEHSRKYRAGNKELIAQRAKERRNAKSAEMSKRDKKSRYRNIERTLSTMFNHLKKNNKRKWPKGHPDLIDVDYLLDLWKAQDGNCIISGHKMLEKNCSLYSVSIDRIDNNFGYIKGNVQLICQGVNLAKNKYSQEEILEFWQNRGEISS